MSGKNDKWLMFKNYMHNELGITKEDIHEWIRDAVKEEAKNLVNQEYGRFSVKDAINKEIYETNWFGGKNLKDTVKQEVAKVLSERITITVEN